MSLLPLALLAGLADSKLQTEGGDGSNNDAADEAAHHDIAPADLLDMIAGASQTGAVAGDGSAILLMDAAAAAGGSQPTGPGPQSEPAPDPAPGPHAADAATGTDAPLWPDSGTGADHAMAGATAPYGEDRIAPADASAPPPAAGSDGVIRAFADINLGIDQGSDLFAWRDNGTPDILEGGAGNERLIFARGDIATGGGGANVFEVWHDPDSPQEVATITDFDPQRDRLDIVIKIDERLHPDCGTWAWDRGVQASLFEEGQIAVTVDPDTGRTEVLVDGEPVARLLGAPEVTPDRIRLLAFWDITT